MILRETSGFIATPAKRKGWVRIATKERGAYPKARTVSPSCWAILENEHEQESAFNGACVLELGIGTFTRGQR
jgi:hypothetical protein